MASAGAASRCATGYVSCSHTQGLGAAHLLLPSPPALSYFTWGQAVSGVHVTHVVINVRSASHLVAALQRTQKDKRPCQRLRHRQDARKIRTGD